MSTHKETAVLVMTDIHYGKRTLSFSKEKCVDRLNALGDKITSIKRCLKGIDLTDLRVFMLGDVNDGSGIYPTQAHHQDLTNVEEQAEELSVILADWFKKQKKHWAKIIIDAVPGNHGRVGKFAHEAANWDIVTYKYLREKLPAGISLHMGNKKSGLFIRNVKIRGHKYLLYHGHDIRSYGNIPWYGMMLRLARWFLTEKLGPFDVACMGHFHTFGTWQMNTILLQCSGTMVTDDEWALQALGWESAAQWHFFGVSDEYPVTWDFGLNV